MTGEILTLTAYFAERERRDGRFLAETMLDLFDQRCVVTSVLLRGIASFGTTNVARSDRSLSMSEDPPVTIVAVDTPHRISALSDEVAAMTDRGVITLQRGHLSPAAPPGETGTVRLSVYIRRRQRIAGSPGYVAVCEALHRLGFTGAEVLLGVDGTVSGQRRTARFFSRNAEVPLLIVGVGTTAQAAAAVDELHALLPDPLFTVEQILVCKSGGETLASPRELQGSAAFQKLTVCTAEDTRYDGRPIHRALIERLKQSDHASGATVFRGIWGFHGGEAPHGDRFPQLTRHVPVSTVIIDTAPNIAASFRIVDELTEQDGLVVCEEIPRMLARHDEHRVGGLQME